MRKLAIIAVAAVLVGALAPGLAAAVPNDFGLDYTGKTLSPGCVCHAGTAGESAPVDENNAHAKMVVDVSADLGALLPSVAWTDYWPSPSYGFGIRFEPTDMFLQVGNNADFTGILEYVALNDTYTVTPADDYGLAEGLEYSMDDEVWEIGNAPVEVVPYFQRCGGCHNLGLTRPSETTVTLASGADIGPNTPTTWTALSITCEYCHGTGDAGTHMASGADVFGWASGVDGARRILSAEICGQCHVYGTTTETRLGSTSAFSNPNGYSADEPLADYFNVYSTVPTEGQFLADPDAYRFYPNGSNKGMSHPYYNEWLQNLVDTSNGLQGHVDPINESAVSRAVAGDPGCLKCHSGEGFLQRIGASIVPSTYQLTTGTPTTVTAEYGITCVVCHTPHSDTTGLGMRGESETADDNDVVDCGDCHNWQYEVLGQTPDDEGGEDKVITGTSRVSHPQRESRAGKGLWGVADGAISMPGVECADCHMPDTRARNRPSHRFHVMLPGKADEWGVADGGDSCTPCHPITSRTDLQAWIDQIQADFDTAYASAGTLQSNALGRLGLSQSVADDATTTPEVIVWQKGFLNRFYADSDASRGVHNPGYLMDGLDAADMYFRSIGAAVSLSAGSATVPESGDSVALSGTALDGEGDPLIGVSVAIEESTDGGMMWAPAGTAVTGATGGFFFGAVVDGPTMFRAMISPSDLDVYSTEVSVDVLEVPAGVVPVMRLADADRYKTAVAISAEYWADESCEDIVLASGETFPDALSASGLAGTVGSPVLLTRKAMLPTEVLDEIERLASVSVTATVHIVGGEGAVSMDVEDAIEDAGFLTVRYAGASRTDTAKLVADAIADIQGMDFAGIAFVANGWNFADALAASPLAYGQGFPVLLTRTDMLSAETSAAIVDNGIDEVYVLGGSSAVNADVYDDIDGLVATIDRWAGADRFSTAATVATNGVTKAWATYAYVGIANGRTFPDALGGGAAAGFNGGVMVLTEQALLPVATGDFLATHGGAGHITMVDVYGGTGAVSETVRLAIYDAINTGP